MQWKISQPTQLHNIKGTYHREPVWGSSTSFFLVIANKWIRLVLKTSKWSKNSYKIGIWVSKVVVGSGVQVITLAVFRVHDFPNSRFPEFWIFFAGEHFDVCLTNPRDGRKCLCSTELCNLGIQTSPNKNNLATQMFFSLLMLPWLSWNLFLWPFCDYLLIKLYLYYSMYYRRNEKI